MRNLLVHLVRPALRVQFPRPISPCLHMLRCTRWHVPRGLLGSDKATAHQSYIVVPLASQDVFH